LKLDNFSNKNIQAIQGNSLKEYIDLMAYG